MVKPQVINRIKNKTATINAPVRFLLVFTIDRRRYRMVFDDADKQVVKPRPSPEAERIKFAYCFRASSFVSSKTDSSQLSSKSSALFLMAIHMRGLNQHIAQQNTMKNLFALSQRQI